MCSFGSIHISVNDDEKFTRHNCPLGISSKQAGLSGQDMLTRITAEARHRGWAWLTGRNNAVSSVTLQQSYSLTRERSRGSEQLTTSRKPDPRVMEKLEIFLFTFLVSHYLWNIVFVSWLFTCFTPTDFTNYGLPN